jgi:hypothetical protein
MKHVFVILETVNGFVDRSNGIIYHRRGRLGREYANWPCTARICIFCSREVCGVSRIRCLP